MTHLINIILIAINVGFYLQGLSVGNNYWGSMFAAGFVTGIEVAHIIIQRSRC